MFLYLRIVIIFMKIFNELYLMFLNFKISCFESFVEN